MSSVIANDDVESIFKLSDHTRLFYFENRFLVETLGLLFETPRLPFELCLCVNLCRIDPSAWPYLRLTMKMKRLLNPVPCRVIAYPCFYKAHPLETQF